MPKPIDEKALGNLIKQLNPYSPDMNQPANIPAVASEGAGTGGADQDAEFHIELDDHIANYSSADWSFRGRTQTIKRALRITYRYPLLGPDQKTKTGFYATEHLLIGYAGGNGGG
jgi:hypothetical protein